ncbi:purine-cytosine permease family protein [Novosphingobium arvoryzae]|uniref:Allantoin permease n=1 Tax=Novosphingobium arvoryzae TaxID=1256514 RepID=A0A918VJG3_9SPHN|nr:cytosine permease [Novosphingobium arvoryzae]GHA02232.1 allantoin permease [Novosphingobium arvoryzae]
MAGAISEKDTDFADEPVPAEARTAWPPLFFATIGMATALIYMQLTSIIALTYGSKIALLAIAYSTLISGVMAWVIASIAVRTGCGTNLLARHILGYRGGSVFSIGLGVNALLFFVLEANIMATSISHVYSGLEKWIVQLVMIGLILPIIWFGMRVLARFQMITFIFYAILLSFALYISLHNPSEGRDWLAYMPAKETDTGTALLSSFGIMNGLVFVTALISADYARFVRKEERFLGTLWVGVGFQLFCFLFAGLLGLWFSVRYSEDNPGSYFVVMLGGMGAVFAIATQMRINVANIYISTMAFVNAIVQITDRHVSRHVMLVVVSLISGILMLLNVAHYIEGVLQLLGIFMICFTVLLVLDSTMRHGNLGETEMAEITSAGIANWHWLALLSLVTANAIGISAMLGWLGAAMQPWASFAAGGAQIILYLVGKAAGSARTARKWDWDRPIAD